MSDTTSGRKERIRLGIENFLQERLTAKIDKLPDDDPKRSDLEEQHKRTAWLEDATRRVKQIQAVTHSLKPIHPEARGTNLYIVPSSLPQRSELGSHVLGEDFAGDVVGNAAALDVYKFLKLEVDDQSLLEGLIADDPSVVAALSDDAEKAKEWRDAFIGLVQPKDDEATSHVLAKQLYWLAGEAPTDDGAYHLLAPLYATSLAHAVYEVIQEDRYGEANKLARQARRERKQHNGVFRDYPNLAVQNLGGTKPQNISQLNSERRGNNYLLSSLPPKWQQRNMHMPWHVSSVIDRYFLNREYIRDTVNQFRQFLDKEPDSTMATRNRVDGYIASLIDLMVKMAGDFSQGMEPGWTKDVRCELALCERLWLDPLRAESDEEFCTQWLRMDWPEQVGARFGVWLNQQLEGKLVLGDVEYRHWKKELLVDEGPDSWAQQLHRMRKKLSGISVEEVSG